MWVESKLVASALWLFGGDFDFIHVDRQGSSYGYLCCANRRLPALLAICNPDKGLRGNSFCTLR